MQKIVPFLWFDNQAEEAVNFYTTIFKDTKIGEITRYDEASAKVSGKPAGSIMTINFQIEGQDFIALNGGPAFTFSQAISFLVNCETQEEIDRLWERLSEGGEIQQCGWLRDKYGVPWQITPVILDGLLRDPDKVKAGRVMESMLQMKKLDVAELKRAYEQD